MEKVQEMVAVSMTEQYNPAMRAVNLFGNVMSGTRASRFNKDDLRDQRQTLAQYRKSIPLCLRMGIWGRYSSGKTTGALSVENLIPNEEREAYEVPEDYCDYWLLPELSDLLLENRIVRGFSNTRDNYRPIHYLTTEPRRAATTLGPFFREDNIEVVDLVIRDDNGYLPDPEATADHFYSQLEFIAEDYSIDLSDPESFSGSIIIDKWSTVCQFITEAFVREYARNHPKKPTAMPMHYAKRNFMIKQVFVILNATGLNYVVLGDSKSIYEKKEEDKGKGNPDIAMKDATTKAKSDMYGFKKTGEFKPDWHVETGAMIDILADIELQSSKKLNKRFPITYFSEKNVFMEKPLFDAYKPLLYTTVCGILNKNAPSICSKMRVPFGDPQLHRDIQGMEDLAIFSWPFDNVAEIDLPAEKKKKSGKKKIAAASKKESEFVLKPAAGRQRNTNSKR
jgi:hypothetical protein